MKPTNEQKQKWAEEGRRRFLDRKQQEKDRNHLVLLDEFIKRNSGIPIKTLCIRLKMGERRVRTLLQKPAGQRLFIIDESSRIFHAKPIEMVRLTDPQSSISSRIEENRRVWQANVDEIWQRLLDRAIEYVASREKFQTKIEVSVENSAKHYLEDPYMSTEFKRKAQEILAVLLTIRDLRAGGEVDPRAFAPFKWPSLQILELVRSLTVSMDPPSGKILATAGYRVGKAGLSHHERRECLRNIMTNQTLAELKGLPPYSCGRLRRIAYAIAYLVRQAKHKTNADMSEAISQWESDMVWLKSNFYDGQCEKTSFTWPVR